MSLAFRKNHSHLSSENLVEWSDELSVGISEIDEQHKYLILLLNKLNEAVTQEKDILLAEDIMHRLSEATKKHFIIEESLMRILEYPGYEAHKAHHRQVIKELQSLRDRMHDGQYPFDEESMKFLKTWLTTHIAEEDKPSTSFCIKRGVKNVLKQTTWLNRIWDANHS